MNFILYIKCSEIQDFSYSNPFFEKLKMELPNSEFLDLDIFSGQELITMAIEGVRKAHKTFVLFDIISPNSTQKFIELVTYLADYPENKNVFINGNDQLISKILFPSTNFCYHNESNKDIVAIINEKINS